MIGKIKEKQWKSKWGGIIFQRVMVPNSYPLNYLWYVLNKNSYMIFDYVFSYANLEYTSVKYIIGKITPNIL
jgi:hypothetical protein